MLLLLVQSPRVLPTGLALGECPGTTVAVGKVHKEVRMSDLTQMAFPEGLFRDVER